MMVYAGVVVETFFWSNIIILNTAAVLLLVMRVASLGEYAGFRYVMMAMYDQAGKSMRISCRPRRILLIDGRTKLSDNSKHIRLLHLQYYGMNLDMMSMAAQIPPALKNEEM